MSQFDLDAYIRKVPDFPKAGILFYDVTGILAEPAALEYCIDAMVDEYREKRIDAVAAIEARGFLFAAPFAVRMHIPLILIRKKGKLPGRVLTKTFQLEYAAASIEIHPDDVQKNQKVLLMDDLIATGGTLVAAQDLLAEAGAIVTDVFGVIGLPFLGYESKLPGIRVHTLINYDSE